MIILHPKQNSAVACNPFACFLSLIDRQSFAFNKLRFGRQHLRHIIIIAIDLLLIWTRFWAQIPEFRLSFTVDRCAA